MTVEKRLLANMRHVDPKFTLTESFNDYTEDENEYRGRVEELKRLMDKLYGDRDYEVIDTLYRLLVNKSYVPGSKRVVESLGENSMVGQIKSKIEWLNDRGYTDILDKILSILTKVSKDGEV